MTKSHENIDVRVTGVEQVSAPVSYTHLTLPTKA